MSNVPQTSAGAEFAPVRTRRAFEDAVAQIADRIHSGALRTGDSLPSERALASQLGISRGTLREAVDVLMRAGVLDAKAGVGGTYVCSDAVPTRLLAHGVEVRLSEVSHVLEARRLFEPRIAQLAAVFAEPDDFALLDRTIELQREYAHDPARQLSIDTRFHVLIARATRNPVAVDMMKELLARIEIVREMALRGPDDPQLAVAVHEKTLAALKARDPARIEAVMDEHLAFLEQRWAAHGGRLRLRRLPDFLLPRAPES